MERASSRDPEKFDSRWEPKRARAEYYPTTFYAPQKADYQIASIGCIHILWVHNVVHSLREWLHTQEDAVDIQ